MINFRYRINPICLVGVWDNPSYPCVVMLVGIRDNPFYLLAIDLPGRLGCLNPILYLDSSGLNITSTATVTELSDGSFDNA